MVLHYFPLIKEVRGRAPRRADETEKTFVGNSLIKARALVKEVSREQPELGEFAVLADDSGLEVDALGGAPGVHSARYAGDHVDPSAHMQKLLAELFKKNIDEATWTARYQCALALIIYSKGKLQEFTSVGSCEGKITSAAQGDSGFGYDPVFFFPKFGKTMAEVSYKEKNSVSHRKVAFEALKSQFLN